LLCALFPSQQLAQNPSPLLEPTGIAYDSAGNLYIADSARHQVFEATLGGVWLVIAGSGVQGFAGDGGTAVNAELNAPQAVAVGADGTLYIADTANQRIRAVSNGVIATIAGNGSAGFSGDNGPAMLASLDQPNALALDSSGALLVCDSANHRLRRISSGTIYTLAGNGVQGFAGDGGLATSAELDTPSGVTVSADGRIFLSDAHNNRIRVIATNGVITTDAAQLSLPLGLAATSSGALVFADTNNPRLRNIDASGNISTLAGSGVQGSAPDGSIALNAALDTPVGVAISTFGNPTFADTSNRTIRILAGNGNLYLPAALASARSSSVALTLPPSALYGQAAAGVAVSGSVPTPQGLVQIFDGNTLAAQAPLTNSVASLSLATLSAGTHTLHAVYSGDGLNPASSDRQPGNYSLRLRHPRAHRLAQRRASSGRRQRRCRLHHHRAEALPRRRLSHRGLAQRHGERQLQRHSEHRVRIAAHRTRPDGHYRAAACTELLRRTAAAARCWRRLRHQRRSHRLGELR
jgi:sugar lactone lactonase YvrE